MEKLRVEWQLLLNSSFYTGEMGSKPLTGGVHKALSEYCSQSTSEVYMQRLPPHQKICHRICSSQHWLQLSLQGSKYIQRVSLSSSLEAKAVTFAVLSSRKIDLMYCTALQNWEDVTSHHRNSGFLKWMGHWIRLGFPRTENSYLG